MWTIAEERSLPSANLGIHLLKNAGSLKPTNTRGIVLRSGFVVGAKGAKAKVDLRDDQSIFVKSVASSEADLIALEATSVS